jgi:hypothetical protein
MSISHRLFSHKHASLLVLIAVNLLLFTDMKKVIELDPSNQQATRSLLRLEPLAAEKREKMKEEMIGKMLPFFSSIPSVPNYNSFWLY